MSTDAFEHLLVEKAKEIISREKDTVLKAVLAHGSRFAGTGSTPRPGSDADLVLVVSGGRFETVLSQTQERPPSAVFRGHIHRERERVPVEARLWSADEFFDARARARWPAFLSRIVARSQILWADRVDDVSTVKASCVTRCDGEITERLEAWRTIEIENAMLLFMHETNELFDIIEHAISYTPVAAMARFCELVHVYCLDVLKLRGAALLQSRDPKLAEEAHALALAHFNAACLKPVRYLNAKRYPLHTLITDLMRNLDGAVGDKGLNDKTLPAIRAALAKHFEGLFNRALFHPGIAETFVFGAY